MDRTKYTDKFLELLQMNQCIKFNHDSTNSIKAKIQCMSRKVKNRLSSKEYYQLSNKPTGSLPGKFYGTVKIHKLPSNGFIDNIHLRPLYQTLVLQVIN